MPAKKRKQLSLSDFIEKEEKQKVKRASVMLPPETHSQLTALTKELNTTYPVVIQALLDYYNENATA